jgi:diguanylate cyclase (GGDEF)-like protein/PAS domain S-box-containing protein
MSSAAGRVDPDRCGSTWGDRSWLAQLCAEIGPDVLTAIDPSGIIRFAGGAIPRLLGLDPDAVVGEAMWSFVHPEDLEAAAGALNEATRTDGYHQPTVFRVRHGDEGWIECETNAVTVDGPGGPWLVLSIRSVADRDLVMGRRRRITHIVQEASIDCSQAGWANVDEVVGDALGRLANVVQADSVELAWADSTGADQLLTHAHWIRRKAAGRAPSAMKDRLRPRGARADRAPLFEPLWTPAATAATILTFSSELPQLERSAVRDRLIANGVHAAVEIPLSPAAPWALARLTFSERWQDWDDVNVDLVSGFACTLMATLQRCAAEETLRRQASTDPLTGLVNRIGLYQVLDEYLADAHADGAVGVLYADLDQFKQVNDRYGHSVGDQLLRDVSDALRRSVRGVDLVARVGGDEFVVVCPDVDSPDHLDRIADRIRTAVRSVRSPNGHVSISVGTSLSQSGLSSDQLIRIADESMYHHKRRQGTDRGDTPAPSAAPELVTPSGHR